MKKIVIAVLILAVVVAVGAYIFLTNIDDITRKIIEKAGTQALGTPVTVGLVAISLSAGKAVIGDLKVANPPGYSPRPAIHFKELSAEIDARTRVIRRVYAGGPVFRIEMQGDRSNFGEFIRKIKHRTSPEEDSTVSPHRKAGADSTTKKKKGTGSSPVFDIRVFDIENARLIISDQQGHTDELTLSRLVLKNLRGTAGEIATQIASQILGRIAAYEARQAIEKRIRKSVEKHGGKGVRDMLKGLGID